MKKLNKIIDEVLTFVFMKHVSITVTCLIIILTGILVQVSTEMFNDILFYVYVISGFVLAVIFILALIFSFIINNKDFN